MQVYPPEGIRIHTPENQALLYEDGLRRAASDGTILEAIPAKCDSQHNLLFQFGDLTGILPRSEAVFSPDGKPVREIAVLKRVGRPTCFRVLALDGGRAVLSRRAAQQAVWDDLTANRRTGDILQAVITTPAQFGAFCDVGCGLTALLPVSRISVSRSQTGFERFVPGQAICAVLAKIDRDTNRITLSHRELLGTWEENASLFSAGQTVTGIVRAVKDYGVFIELTPNLSGLAEPDGRLAAGDAVSVYIKSIQPDRRKIKLSVISLLSQVDLPPQPMRYFRTEGHLDCWQYHTGAALTIF